MKKGESIASNIKIEKLIPGGQGIGALDDGKKVLLWNTLPGETVTSWQLTRNKSSFAEGIALAVTHTHTERVTPKDECYLSTSPWQIMNYHYELTAKTDLLTEIFRQAKIEFQTSTRPDSIVCNIVPQKIQTNSQDYYYRNKMEYALYYNNETKLIQLAFHHRGSHRKLPITGSSLEMPAIWKQAASIVDQLNLNHNEARRYQSLLLRANQAGEVSGGLLENGKPHPVFPELGDTILGDHYSYSPNGFFQINIPIYELALRAIKSHINTDQVLDLYAGVGTIGLSVAQEHNLTLVECNKSAYQEMLQNCQTKPWAKPILAKSEEALEYIQTEQTVILDPPRAGCQPSLIEKLKTVKPIKIIYLSCNPVTQARDVRILLEQNTYQIIEITPFNFFPHTPHLENLIILERKTHV